MSTRYFRVPHTIDENGTDLGVPEIVTRNIEYHPDANALIGVDDADDADAFAALGDWVEVIGSSELPAAPASATVTVTSTATSTSASDPGAGATGGAA
jgi:hypothetical protein